MLENYSNKRRGVYSNATFIWVRAAFICLNTGITTHCEAFFVFVNHKADLLLAMRARTHTHAMFGQRATTYNTILID